MPESNNTLIRQITVDQVHEALDQIVARYGDVVEQPELPCDWPQLCDVNYCRFPHYVRGGEPVGLTAEVLVRLGLPRHLLRELDMEYEMSELLHPGVKISRSRNPILQRIDSRGMALLQYVQDHQKVGWSWRKIVDRAFARRWMITRLDARRRPWLY